MNPRTLPRLLAVFALLVLSGTLIAAQKQPAKKPSKAKTAKPAKSKAAKPKPADPLAEWNRLDRDRRAIGKELKELRIEFTIAARKRKLEIKDIFEKRLARWNDELRPKMIAVSLAKLESDPDNEMAAAMAREMTEFQKVEAVTDRLLKAGKETGPVLVTAGLTQYRLNNFKRAETLLEQARDKNARLSNSFFIDVVQDQQKNWQREIDLRKKQAAAKPDKQLPRVKVETDKGPFVIELFEEEAPNTVANFITLVEQKYYDGLRVHGDFLRAGTAQPIARTKIPAVVIGDEDTRKDFDPKRIYGTLLPTYTIKAECFKEDARLHFRGSLSMVTSTSDGGYADFAILRQPMPGRNPDSRGFSGKTVFGYVKTGMEVVDKLDKGAKIIRMTVDFKRKHAYKPKTSLDKPEDPKSKDGKPPAKKDGAKSKPAKKDDAKSKPAPKPKEGKKTLPAKTGIKK